MQKKLKALTRAVEALDVEKIMENVKKTLRHADGGRGRPRESSKTDEGSRERSSETPAPSSVKRLSQQLEVMQQEMHSSNEKFQHRQAEHFALIEDGQRKVNFLETLVQNLKKRITEIQKQNKNNAALLRSATAAQSKEQEEPTTPSRPLEQAEAVGASQ